MREQEVLEAIETIADALMGMQSKIEGLTGPTELNYDLMIEIVRGIATMEAPLLVLKKYDVDIEELDKTIKSIMESMVWVNV